MGFDHRCGTQRRQETGIASDARQAALVESSQEALMSSYQGASAPSPITRPASYRWMQLLMGIVCMAMIANLQYGWTLFVNPIAEKHGWTRAAIQIAFTIFVVTETWLV